MEFLATALARIGAYTVVPLCRPIVGPMVRPLKAFWEYKKNLKKLNKEMVKLDKEREEIGRSISDGAEVPAEVEAWLEKVTEVCDQIFSLITEHDLKQRNSSCCSCSCTYNDVMEGYKNRKNAAKMLKDSDRLNHEVSNSKYSWDYKINIENLKKKVEDLVAKRDSLFSSIKDGEEATPLFQVWLYKFDTTVQEVARLIASSQQNF